jgi:hypothetical protein
MPDTSLAAVLVAVAVVDISFAGVAVAVVDTSFAAVAVAVAVAIVVEERE